MFSLELRRLPRADNPYVFGPVGVGHNQNPIGAGHSNSHEPLFRLGMIRVGIGYRQRITKDCRRFQK